MFKRVKKNKKGFTLAELLIVVAIIAVLVAISIPIFNAQLEKSREATDAANIRSAYAEVMTSALTEPDAPKTISVPKQQKQDGWQNTSITDIGGVAIANINSKDATEVKYTPDGDGKSTGTVTIDGKNVTEK